MSTKYTYAGYSCLVKTIPSKVDILLGNITDLTEEGKFGFVQGLDAFDVPRDVWQYGSDGLGGADVKTFLTSAQPLFIVSDSVVDTTVTVKCFYIDGFGVEQGVTKTLNGQMSIPLDVIGLDVIRASVESVTEAVGNIDISSENAFTAGVPDDVSKVLAYIGQSYGQTEQCLLTVPLNTSMILNGVYVYIAREKGAAGSAQVDLRVREFGKSWVVKRPWQVTTSFPISEDVYDLIFPARSQVVLRVRSISDSDTHVTGILNYYLVSVAT